MPSLLVVDDTPLIRSTIVRLLERENLGFSPVFEASNGMEAIQCVRRERPDVVFMDIRMPGMDGLQVSSLIRAEMPDIRIVILTAYDEFAYAQKALKLGAFDYLLKPVRPAKLIEVLNELHKDIRSASAATDQTLLAEKAAPPSIKRDPVRRAVTFIQQHYDRPISLAEVARTAHLSPSHLASIFKNSIGISYKQYLTAQRMDAAKRLLQTTDWSVDVIAEQVGYPNVTNFYRLFQRQTGQTPAAYRRQSSATPLADHSTSVSSDGI